MLQATHQQIEQMLQIGEAMEAKLKEWADELRDEEEGFVVRLYERELEELEDLTDRFNCLRHELEGRQQAMGALLTPPADPPTEQAHSIGRV